jgi:hypothetical protein
MIERAHRTIKTAMMARKEAWLQALAIVLLGIRSLPNESGFSPFTAVTGANLLLPRPLITETNEDCSEETISKLQEIMRSIDFQSLSEGRSHVSTKSYIPKDLQTCTHVWLRIDRVRKHLEAPYTGPHLVVKRTSKYFVINTGSLEQTVSIDRLKPAYCQVPQDSKLKQNPSIDLSKKTEQKSAYHPPVTDTSSEPENSEQPTPGTTAADQPQRTTRSGRRVNFRPKADFIYY